MHSVPLNTLPNTLYATCATVTRLGDALCGDAKSIRMTQIVASLLRSVCVHDNLINGACARMANVAELRHHRPAAADDDDDDNNPDGCD